MISHQDLVMYRPFMTCDDPKGVVECGSIRKYRAGSQKVKDKTKSRRTAENSKTSLANKSVKEEMDPKGCTENSLDPASLQLMEVSRGAQRLNNMIDSWSRGMRYDGRSEDIAKDLLKGALDLQESLAMLRKLQETSQHMSCLKKKHNEKPQRGSIDSKMANGTYTNQFSEQSYPMGFERPRLSVDGYSRNCSEELKTVIKDSLVRQNLFPTTTTEGLDSASEIPSTSSSQSSGVHTDRYSDSSVSSATSKKVRGPNLVAKLMGIEDVPSRPFPADVQKPLHGEKILNQRRPIFEIDMPKVRRTSSTIEKVDPERKKTLSEILETMHFKGLLKKSSVLEPELQIHHFKDSHSKTCDNLPPIVLMKPRCSLHHESVRSDALVPPGDLSLRKLKADVVPFKSINHNGSSTTSTGNKTEEVTKRLTQGEKPKLQQESLKLKEKEILPIEKFPNKGTLYSHVSHKPQVREAIDKKAKVKTIAKKLPEKEISKPKIVAISQDKKEITPTKLRTPPSGSTRIKKNEIPGQHSTALTTNSKTKTLKNNNVEEQRKNQKKKQKPVLEPEAAKPVAEQSGPEEEKSFSVPCEDDCTEIRTIAEQLAPEEDQRFAVPCKDDCTEIRTIAEQLAPEEDQRFAVPCKDDCTEIRTIAEQLAPEEEKSILVPCKDDCTQIRTIAELAVDRPVEHEVDTSANKIGEDCNQSQSSSGDDVTLLKSKHDTDATSAEEAHDGKNGGEADNKVDKEEGAELKCFLLTSQSFIGHAEQLLNLDVDYPMTLGKYETNGKANLKLYLDCANELTQRKSLQESQIVHPFLLTCAGNSRLQISLVRLVEEIYNAIEKLKFYTVVSGEKLSVDNLYAMMKRDIKCIGMINGIWDCGWRHGFSADEAEQVVNEVESLVLSGLIEELIVDL